MTYTIDKKFPVSEDFFSIVQEMLKDKLYSAQLSSDGHAATLFMHDMIRESIRNFNITFNVSGNCINSISISTESVEDEKINEYDLKNYLNDLLVSLLIDERSEGKKKFVIRNYLTFFNSHPMKIDLTLRGKYKMHLSCADFPPNQEPLNENFLMIDAEIEASSLSHAMSLSYNNARNVGAFLAILLDVGFFTPVSERRIFIQKTNQNGNILFGSSRFRTGYFDGTLGLVVKDNLNGLKSVYDTETLEQLFSGVISNQIVLPASHEKEKPLYVYRIGNNEHLEKTFLEHKIKDGDGNTNFCETVEKDCHYMNLEIQIPKQIRSYFRNIYKIEASYYRAFLSAARLYNIALTSGLHEPTVEVSYKISAVEALGKAEQLGFSQMLQKYVDFDFDKKLSDYYYGNIRSGHFHSGDFAFNEYDVSLVSEFDFSFKEKFEQKKHFDKIIRNCLVNWMERNVIGMQ